MPDVTQQTKDRREFFATAAAAAAMAASLPVAGAHAQAPAVAGGTAAPGAPAEVVGGEHWATKRVAGQSVRLFMWNKKLRNAAQAEGRSTLRGTILFVHGSSVSSTPVFDLQIPGKP